jgi:hypothetical protein
MSNTVYDSARGLFLAGSLSWSSDTIKVALVRSYSFSSAHANLSDITGGGGGTIVATSSALSSKTTTAGVADAADVTFTAVAAGAACGNLIFYKDTGTASTSSLIASIDTGTGLPITPNSADIVVVFDNGSNKIFKL